MNWNVRPMEKNDLEQIAKLQLRVFSRKRELKEVLKHFEWKYFKNPNGNAKCAVAITSQNQIIGIYGSIPIKIKLENNQATVNYVVTTAVDKEYQRKSILKQLFDCYQNEVLNNCASSICFGFPNPLAYRIGRKYYNYNQILRVHTYRIPISIRAKLDFPAFSKQGMARPLWQKVFLKKIISPLFNYNPYKNFQSKKNLKINECSKIPEDYSDFWDSCSKNYNNIVIRNAEYLKWRFFDEPEKQYKFLEIRTGQKLVGYFVLAIGSSTQILDFLVLKESDLIEDAFYCMLEYISRNKKIDLVSFPIYDFALELILQSNIVQIMNISNFVNIFFSESDQALLKIFNQPANWYLSGNEFSIA